MAVCTAWLVGRRPDWTERIRFVSPWIQLGLGVAVVVFGVGSTVWFLATWHLSP